MMYTSCSSPFHIIVGASYKESPNIANKNTKLIYHISCSLPSPSPKFFKKKKFKLIKFTYLFIRPEIMTNFYNKLLSDQQNSSFQYINHET